MPPTPCTPNTSSESSAPSSVFRPFTPHRQTRPASRPITSAPIGPTKPAAGVIATSPATAPEAAPSIEGLPLNIHFAAASRTAWRRGGQHGVDEGQAGDAVGGAGGTGIEAEPAHPQQRGADHGHGQECGAIASRPKPMRLPSTKAPTRPATRGVDMDHGAAGEVERALLEQQPPGFGRAGQAGRQNHTMWAIGR